MIDRDYCLTMARYNQWMNEKLYARACTLSDSDRRRDLGAFFGSLHATLDHILWADRVWLHRLAGREPPATALGEVQYAEFERLHAARADLDRELLEWAAGVDADWLGESLTWRSGADGATRTRPISVLVVHLFNHQTHHRGQATALLTRLGVDPGVTDLPWMPGLDGGPP